jgi:hypothetical protein
LNGNATLPIAAWGGAILEPYGQDQRHPTFHVKRVSQGWVGPKITADAVSDPKQQCRLHLPADCNALELRDDNQPRPH